MGRQTNFYMAGSDEDEFMAFVRSERTVGVFCYMMPTAEIPLLERMPSRLEPFWGTVYLWNRQNSLKPIIEYVPEQNYYVVEPIASEVIEFSRSYIDDGLLVRGRIWAEMTGWNRGDPATIFRKSDAFRKWYAKLASWIKRRSVRNRVHDYLLPGAAAFAESNGKLVQAIFAKQE